MSTLLFFTGGQLNEWEGDVLFTMGPQSSYGYEFPLYVGTVVVSFQPGAQFQIEHHEIGNVQLSLQPASQAAIEHSEVGSVELTLHTLRTIHFADYVYQGNIGLSISPNSGYVHDLSPVVGAIALAVSPQSPYSHEWVYQGSIAFALVPASGHFADYPYQGEIVLSLNPASSHFADYLFTGTIIAALNPQASYGQDFSYPGAVLFSLTPNAAFIQDFSYQGNALFFLIPQASALVAEGDSLVFDAAIIREILREAVISKTRLFIASGITRNRELEAHISKTLAFHAAMKKEASDEAGR